MTFESVKDRIIANTAPANLDEIISDIHVLADGIAEVDQLIAIRLYESQQLHGKKNWLAYAREVFGCYNDKATYYRRVQVGEILFRLRQQETDLFRQMLRTGITLLEHLLPIMNYPGHGYDSLVHFLQQYWHDDWTRDQLIVNRDRYLYPDGRDGQPVQLEFKFDTLAIQEEAEIVDYIESNGIAPAQAGVMAVNGVRLCAAAMPYLTAHPDEFDDEDIPFLEDARCRLEQAAGLLGELITAKSRKALNI